MDRNGEIGFNLSKLIRFHHSIPNLHNKNFNYFLTAIKNESIDDLCKTNFLVSSSSFNNLTPVSPKSPFNLNLTYFFENYQL